MGFRSFRGSQADVKYFAQQLKISAVQSPRLHTTTYSRPQHMRLVMHEWLNHRLNQGSNQGFFFRHLPIQLFRDVVRRIW